MEPVAVPRPAVFDTSIFVAQESRALETLTEWAPVMSVVTLAELSLGVEMAKTAKIRALRAQTLATAKRAVVVGVVVDELIDVPAAWVTLRRSLTRKMPANDSWIAATALALGIPVVTQDDDYDAASGVIEVIKI
jgi:predicted nucleic acid-binding protein